MKNVMGIDSTPVMPARYGPQAAGMTSTSHCAMSSTMPVPLMTPVSTPAAMTMATTVMTDDACEASSSCCSRTVRKLTIRATTVPSMNR